MTQASAGWTGWLEATAAATAMRQSLWLYPIVEILHIIGFVVLVGSAAMFDLRLLGFSRQLPVTGMERHLLPWARASVLLIVPTGGLMFVAHATEFAGNPAFRMKLLFLVPAGRRMGSRGPRPARGARRGRALADAVDGRDRLRTAAGVFLEWGATTWPPIPPLAGT